MRMRQRRYKRKTEAADLDVTPFMNLMIVLVPVLLLSMVFTHTTVIDLNFPADGVAGSVDPESVHLEIQVLADELVIADQRGIIKRLPRLNNGEHDYDALSIALQDLKRRIPGKRDATILLEANTNYQTIVSTMDRTRSFPTVQAGQLVLAELFPVLSLGDVPKEAES